MGTLYWCQCLVTSIHVLTPSQVCQHCALYTIYLAMLCHRTKSVVILLRQDWWWDLLAATCCRYCSPWDFSTDSTAITSGDDRSIGLEGSWAINTNPLLWQMIVNQKTPQNCHSQHSPAPRNSMWNFKNSPKTYHMQKLGRRDLLPVPCHCNNRESSWLMYAENVLGRGLRFTLQGKVKKTTKNKPFAVHASWL